MQTGSEVGQQAYSSPCKATGGEQWDFDSMMRGDGLEWDGREWQLENRDIDMVGGEEDYQHIGSQFNNQQATAGSFDFEEAFAQIEQEAESWPNDWALAGATSGLGVAPGFLWREDFVEAAYRAPQETLQHHPAAPTATASLSAVTPPVVYVSGDFCGGPAPRPAAPQANPFPAPAPAPVAVAPLAAALLADALPAAALPAAAARPAAAPSKKPWVAAGKKAVVKNNEVVIESRRGRRGWGKGRDKGGYNVADPVSRRKLQNCQRKQQVEAEKLQEEKQWASVYDVALRRMQTTGGDVDEAKRLAAGAGVLVPYVKRIQAAGATTSAQTKWKSEENKREQRFEAWQVAANWAKLAGLTPPTIVAESTSNQFKADWKRGLVALGLPENSTFYGSGPPDAMK